MTVTSTTKSVSYEGGSGASSFTVPFKFLADSHLVVTKTSSGGTVTALVNGSDYTVSGAGASTGGTVTFASGTLDSGYTLTIERNVPLTQSTDLRNQGAFLPETHEQTFDLLAMQAQQLDKKIDDLETTLRGEIAANPDAEELSARTVKATGSSVARSLAVRFAEEANVKDYGAKGDGSTDDTAAIQAAIDTGKPVRFPDGVYIISDTLNLTTDGQTMRGTGKEKVTLKNTTDADPLLYIGSATPTAGHQGQYCAVEGIGFYGNAATTGGIRIFGVVTVDGVTYAARDVTLRSIQIEHIDAGIALQVGAWETDVEDLTVWDCKEGIRLEDQPNACSFVGCYISRCADRCIYAPQGSSWFSNVTFKQITAQYSGSDSTTNAWWAAGTTYAVDNTVLHNGTKWKSLQGANTGVEPGVTTGWASWWTEQPCAIIDLADGFAIDLDTVYLEGNNSSIDVALRGSASQVCVRNVMHNLVTPSGKAGKDLIASNIKGLLLDGVVNIGGDVNSLVTITGTLPLSTIRHLYMAVGSATAGVLVDNSTRKATTYLSGQEDNLGKTIVRALTTENAFEIRDSATDAVKGFVYNGRLYLGATNAAPNIGAAGSTLEVYAGDGAATAWSSGATYAINDAVVYLGAHYTSLQNANTNKNPVTETAWWKRTLGAVRASQILLGLSSLRVRTAAGSPEGAYAADVGSVYLRDNGTANNTFYVKESGTSTTGWVAIPGALIADLASTANTKGASLIGVEDAAGSYTATTVEGVLAEVASMRIVKRTATITLAEMQALGAGVKTISKNVGAALPANARVVGSNYALTLIDNAGDTATVAAKAGGTDDDGLVALSDVTTGSGTALAGAGNGALSYPFAPLSGQQVTMSVTAVEDLNTMTKGEFAVNVFYVVLA